VVWRDARRRWLAVVAVVLVLVAIPVAVARWPVGAVHTDPATLRARILASAAVPYAGYVSSQGQVVLPDLPQLGDVTGLFGGTNSMRVWHASATSWRVAVLQPTGEHDIYQTADAAYTWDYSHNLWTEIIGTTPARLPWAADVLPPDLARRFLAGAGPGDELTLLPPQRIAGVDAAGLRLQPTDPDTTVHRLDIWADPVSGLPLRVDVGGVFTSRFLDLSRVPPTASVVTPDVAGSSSFTSTTSSGVLSQLNNTFGFEDLLPPSLAGHPLVSEPVKGVVAYGAGLSRFVVVPLPGRLGRQSLDALHNEGGAPVPGGYYVSSAVLTVLVVRPAQRRTYLLAGFVTPTLLQAAADELR